MRFYGLFRASKTACKPRLLFVTSTFHTRWEIYSQGLVRGSGLADYILRLDGRKDWHPLNFVSEALKHDSEYIIHIDEDCFLIDPGQLRSMIQLLEQDDELAAAIVPGGGTPYRNHNPHAGNLFFAVFKTSRLRESIARNPDWRSLRFSEDLIQHLKTRPEIGHGTTLDDFEPYYPVFWVLLRERNQFMMLSSCFHQETRGSEIRMGDAYVPMVLHAWHLRQWFSERVDPEIGFAPAEKYRRIAWVLRRHFLVRPWLWWSFCRSWLDWLWRRNRSGSHS